MKIVLEEKLKIIEELKQRGGDAMYDEYDSGDELTAGVSTRAKLKRKVFKKIEHLNEFIRTEVAPEIHERYAKEIEELIKGHNMRIENIDREH